MDVLLSRVGEVEDEVFQRRKCAEDREAQRRARNPQFKAGARRVSADAAVANEGNAILEHFRKTQQSLGVIGTNRDGGANASSGRMERVGGESSLGLAKVSSASAENSVVTAEKNKAAALALRSRLGKAPPCDSTGGGSAGDAPDGGEGEGAVGEKRMRPADSESDSVGEESGQAAGKHLRFSVDGSGGDSCVDGPVEMAEPLGGIDLDNDEVAVSGEEDCDDDDDDADVGDVAVTPLVGKGGVSLPAVAVSSLPSEVISQLSSATDEEEDKRESKKNAILADVVKARLQVGIAGVESLDRSTNCCDDCVMSI